MKHILLRSAALALVLSAAPAHAEDVSARITALEQELASLKRQLAEQKAERSAIPAPSSAPSGKQASVEIGPKGVAITSPDKRYELRLKGQAQVDGRYFANDDNNTGKDEIIARRLRPTIEGDADDFSFRLTPDFAGGSAKVLDAYIDYKPTEVANLRVGKFKPPVGLERLQSSSNLLFVERGHPTSLAPNRDFGVQLSGDVLDDALEYQLGVFNGNPDGASDDGDDDDKKDLAARLFAHPFNGSDVAGLEGLGLGVGGSVGDRDGSASNTILSDYKSPGQQSIFRYSSGTYADGTHWRLSPQAYYYAGPFGALAEYAVSNQEVTNGGVSERLEHSAWQLAASYLLTGEKATFGGVKPAEDFNLDSGGIGAWELAARLGQIDFDDAAFGPFASAASAVTEATSYGVGVNWYLNQNVKWQVDYDLTEFNGGAAAGADRPEEHAVFTRVQYTF